jgi:NADPH:quinone reductase-like Zn-dependent oxidoreductase
MRAAVLERYGTLAVRDVETPSPGDGEVLVRVRALSVNAVDWYGLMGRPYVARPLMGLVRPRSDELGSDFAGVVETVGAAVTDLRAGDEVYGCGGRFAEYVVAAKAVALKPASLTFEEAAAVPVAGLTALQGVRDHGGLRRTGQRLLVNGAAGGVGTFAVQVGKALGAEVHAVCSGRNVEQTRALGAERVFDYGREDFTRSGERYDVLFDNAGSRSWAAMRRVLTADGTVVLVGGPRRRRLLGPLGHVVRIKLAAIPGARRAVFFIAKPNREDLDALRGLIDEGRIRPVIERLYALDEIVEAMRAMDDGHARAKIVVSV